MSKNVNVNLLIFIYFASIYILLLLEIVDKVNIKSHKFERKKARYLNSNTNTTYDHGEYKCGT